MRAGPDPAATRGDDAKAKAAATALAAAKPCRRARGGGEGFAVNARHLLERASAARARRERLPAIRRCDHLGRCGSSRPRRDGTTGLKAARRTPRSSTAPAARFSPSSLTIAAGVRSLRFALGLGATLAPGDYQVQIRAKGTAAPLGAMESVRVSIAAAPVANGAVVLRRSVRRPAIRRCPPRISASAEPSESSSSTDNSDRRRYGATPQPRRTGDDDSRNRGHSERCRWITLAHGATRARATRRGRLRHRTDCRLGNHPHRLSRAAVARLVVGGELAGRLSRISPAFAHPSWEAQPCAHDSWFWRPAFALAGFPFNPAFAQRSERVGDPVRLRRTAPAHWSSDTTSIVMRRCRPSKTRSRQTPPIRPRIASPRQRSGPRSYSSRARSASKTIWDR